MGERTSYTPGTFSWVELACQDAAAVKPFYQDLFGWSVNDIPIGEYGFYHMFQLDGKDVAATYTMQGPEKEMGLPSHWKSYITVANVDETTEKASALGAKVLVPPMDVFDSGRTAQFMDPTGAAFCIWQAKNHIGARHVNDPNTLSWNELMTNDVEGSKQFYIQLFGWTAETAQMESNEYTSFMNDGRMNGGMMAIQKEWGEVPPHWGVYFSVEKCDAAAEKIKSLGGSILSPPMDIPEVGRFAVASDPQGGHFNVIELLNPED